MTGRWSISGRLVALLIIGVGVLWLIAAAMTALVTTHEINELFDSALQETAQRLLPLAEHDLDEHDEADGLAIGTAEEVAKHQEYLLYQVRNRAGAILVRSHDAPAEPFPVPLQTGFFDADGRRYYTEMAEDGDLLIQVTEARSHRTEALYDSLVWLLAPLLLLIPAASVAIVWTVRRAVRPINALREEIRARSGSNLAPASEAGLPSELAPIVRDVNRLLERLKAALDAERAFAADSAHELRTPVASALAQVQRLGAELGAGPHKARIEQIVGALHRLAGLVEKLLQLSRADSGIGLSGEPTDTLPVVRLIIAELERSAERAGRILFEDGGRDELVRAIDIDAFAIAFRNLIDNALRHGSRAEPVRISIAEDGAIHIINGGAIVPAEELRRLTHRFARGATAAGGSGLGLAIAETIIRQAGGRLELHSPPIGARDGFEAVVRLPEGAANRPGEAMPG
jgi:two-component system OmpR family sensor kinase